MAAKKILDQEVKIEFNDVELNAFLNVPDNARGLVLFAHGSGSGRLSPRNQMVAKFFQENRLATLLMDLLTKKEEEVDQLTRELRFNIPFLAERLNLCTDWVKKNEETRDLSIGYFGSSTGAAAAIVAGVLRGNEVKAIVSRGGRPDLAGSALFHVVSPTLLIVGSNDFGVIELNKKAFECIPCEKKLEFVSGATHLFEEPGALEQAAKMALGWFGKHFS